MVKSRLKKHRMTGSITPGLILLFVVAFGMVATGCGSSGEAGQYIKQGDAIWEQIGSKSSEMCSAISSPFNNISNPAGFQADIAEARSVFAETYEKIDRAIAEYEKVSALQGADAHVEYASIMIRQCKQTKELLSSMEVALIEQGKNAQGGYLEEMGRLRRTFQTDYPAMLQESLKMPDRAIKLKQELGL
ncbi:MAG: hypothetical protein ACYC99_18095 [Candidatus Geothermincolia bacterium]